MANFQKEFITLHHLVDVDVVGLILLEFIAEMEAENKLYADMHGGGHARPAPDPPRFTSTLDQQPQGQFQGVPPYGQSIAVASPYYAPPSASGAGHGVPPLAQQQQQQQQVTVVAANQSPVVYVERVESYSCAIAYSCYVIWCCNWPLGLIAFSLASEYATISSIRGGSKKLGHHV